MNTDFIELQPGWSSIIVYEIETLFSYSWVLIRSCRSGDNSVSSWMDDHSKVLFVPSLYSVTSKLLFNMITVDEILVALRLAGAKLRMPWAGNLSRYIELQISNM